MTELTTEHPDPLGGHGSLAHEIVGAMREPFLVLDARGAVVAANEPFCLRFGLSTGRILGRPLREAGAGEWDVPELARLLTEVAPRSERVEDFAITLRPFAAPPRPLRLHLRPLRADGRRAALLLVAVEEAPAPAPAPPADPLARIAEGHRGELVALFAADGRCRYLGAGSAAILGRSAAEVRAARACALLGPRDAARLRAALAEARGSEPVRMVFGIRHPDGRPRTLEATVRPVRGPAGEPLLHAAICDVGARQRAEDALRWVSRQTRAILDAAAEGIVGVDPRGLLTLANPAAGRMLGVDPMELVGEPHGRLIAGTGGRPDPVAATLRDGIARTLGDALLRRTDGSEFHAELTCTAARDGDRISAAVLTFRDLTERRLAEQALRRSQWLAGVGETLVALRHRVNNPLTVLLAEAALLEMPGNPPHEERAMVARVAAAAREVGEAVRELGVGAELAVPAELATA